jgi:sugar/nucleoside kinase (ribokinase family)
LDGQFMPAAIQAARWARAAGVKVCFDGNHLRPGVAKLLPLVDWLVVAESFPAAYTGMENPGAAAKVLLAEGAELLTVTLGARGCRVWAADSPAMEEGLHVPGFAVEAIDTTGAGDAFHGGFLYAMLQGWDLARVATFANAVAAINCRTLGGRRGLPTRDDVAALLADQGDQET